MIIDCIGCIHGARPKLRGGDILIITGDLTARDLPCEHEETLLWLQEQKYKKKVLVPGNHDGFLESNPRFFDNSGIDYLLDSGTQYHGVNIWGTPWSSFFERMNPKCMAFTYKQEAWFYEKKISMIPHDVDILVTHTPVFGILDGIPQEDGSLRHAGSHALYSWLEYVARPKLHVFSHIHEAYGREEKLVTKGDNMMISVNCSIMNKSYKPVNKPIRVKL